MAGGWTGRDVDSPLHEIRISDGWATGVRFLPDGGVLTTAVDPFVRRWSETEDLLCNYEGHTKSVDALALFPDGRRFVSGSVDGTARIWDIETGETLALLSGHKKTVAAVAVTPDGKTVVTGSYDRAVKMWDAVSGVERLVIKGHQNNVVGVAVSPDGAVLVSGGVGSDLMVWRLEDGVHLHTIEEAHGFAAIPVAFTGDGSCLVSTGADDTLAVWSTKDWSRLRRIDLGAPGTHAAALAPDDTRVAVTLDHAVRVIDLGTEATVQELRFDVKGVYGVSFSADGSKIATATADSCVRVWRAATDAAT